mmetsp:Transcript_16509/g.35701  ORF Transcript_16509/g.35701 Transcript_16509/m.35701 type:complete len:186 (+) Transcript_16509:70-627(+)
MSTSTANMGSTNTEFPKAEFISDVASFMEGKTVDTVLQDLQDRYRKFKLVESQLLQKKAKLLTKLPEIQKALDIVNKLISASDSGQELVMDFELSESVFAKTKVENVQTVNLWLGAGVMVEYPLEEAKQLLETNLSNCKTNLKTVTADLDFVKDSATTMEVSIARVYNFDVERRRKAKDEGQTTA